MTLSGRYGVADCAADGATPDVVVWAGGGVVLTLPGVMAGADTGGSEADGPGGGLGGSC